MSTHHDPALVHARALRGRGSTLPPGFTPPAEILESWARCLDHGLDFAARVQLPIVGGAELAQRRERAAPVRRLARAELDTLMQQIAGSNYLLAFADGDGVILDVVTDNRFAMQGSEDIIAGSSWREEFAGTSGLGTALASGRCVAVTGPEHYYLRLADVSCTASPIRDAQGEVVGLLDASSYVESRQHHTRALVQMAASHIENMLLAEQRGGDLLIAIHPRREFLRTISAGLLAFDGDGVLTALNGRAQTLLAGLNASRGTHFDQLFAERFDRFVARMHGQNDIRLTDALGSTLVARWVARRPDVQARLVAAAAPEVPLPEPAAPAAEAAPALVADDPMVAGALHTATQAARLKLPLLLRGDTGTGKDALVRAAHAAAAAGGRRGPLRVLPCAGLAPERAEAVLFGQPDQPEPGGLLREAHGGTLLLDEVTALPLALQSLLLRFLDDGQVRVWGETTPRQLDVLVMATTQLDIDAEVVARRFRADLLYRLGAVRVQLPTLARRADFDACARAVLAALSAQAHLDVDALALLRAHSWPGNLHELRAVLARALLGAGNPAGLIDAQAIRPLLPAPTEPGPGHSELQRQATQRVLAEIERHGGSISKAARVLGVSRTTIYRHLRHGDRLRQA